MGVAGIEQLPRSSKIASCSWNLNKEALLKGSFKNIDWLQKYKALKSKIVKKHNFIRKMALENKFSISETSQPVNLCWLNLPQIV